MKLENRHFKNELLEFYFIFFASVLFVYFVPVTISRLYFLVLLFLFWKSKKDYFWFALVFLIINEPGALFHGEYSRGIKGIPNYTIVPGLTFTFFHFFFIFSFFKSLIKGRRTRVLLRNPLLFILFYFLFLWLLTFSFGIDYKNLNYYVKIFFVFLIFISFPLLVYRKEEIYTFIHLILPIIFFLFFSQMFQLFTGSKFGNWLSGVSEFSLAELSASEGYYDFIRLTVAPMLVFFCYIFSLFFSIKKDYKGSKIYLYLIITICLLLAYLSATRSWIIMFLSIFVFYLIFFRKDIRHVITLIGLMFFIAILLYKFVPRLDYRIEYSTKRLATVEMLLEGDVTAGGTLRRIDVRLPKVLEGFTKNPIFGWGFSDTYRKYADGHVGNFNLLLQGGIVGFIIFLFFWISYLRMILSTKRRLSNNNHFKKPLLVLSFAFGGMLLLHFTSYQFFSYGGVASNIYFIIIFIFISEAMVKEAINFEVNSQNNLNYR